jgi:hypothetical protein
MRIGNGGQDVNERRVPDELAPFEAELAGVEQRVERRIDPGATALTVSVAVLVLIGSLLLPWTGGAPGWEILAGVQQFGILPRLFAFTALGFGVVGSALALATRWWPLAWACALGCGFSVVDGAWAIWSRQVGVLEGTSGGAQFGLVVALLAVVVLAASWVRITLRRG